MNDRDARTEPTHHDQELDWLAFCYIADELDELARSNFEARLQDDTVAQQAVVDAMEQAQLIYASLDEAPITSRQPVSPASRSTVVPKRNSLRRAGMLFTSAAAMAMLVAGWGWHSHQPAESAVANGDSDRLASAWVETLVSMNEGDLELWIEDEIQAVEVSDELPEDWMFVALTDLESSMEGPE